MKIKMLRYLSALLCLVLVTSSIPIFAEEPSAIVIEAQQIPISEPTAEPGDEPSPEPGSEEGENPAASLEPGAEPSGIPGDLPVETPSADAQLAGIIEQWIQMLNESGVSGDFDRALWLYNSMLSSIQPGSGDSAYAALVEGQANSLGYALAYNALLNAAGIESAVIDNGDCAWNIVSMDGEWTHVDLFTGDSTSNPAAYFGLTDTVMARERSWSSEAPDCTGTKNNYCVRTEGYHAVDGHDSLRALLADAVEGNVRALNIYNVSAPGSLSLENAVTEILAEIAPQATASVSENGCYAEITIEYRIAMFASAPKTAVEPTGVTLTAERVWIGLGEKLQLTPIFAPEGATGTVSYKSSSTKVASVNASGLLTSKATGKTTITVTTDNGHKATLVIGVTKAPTGVSMTGLRTPLYESETLKLGYTLPNKASGGATFTSSNPEVVSVTPDGHLKAVSKGTATITVTTYNGKKKTANVTVYAEPTAVYPALSEVSIGAEDSWVLGYSFKEGEMGSVTFKSTNEEVATVDASGRIRALKEGETEIILTTHNEKEAKCKVKVTPAPAGITLSGRTWIGLGEKIQLEAIIDPTGTMGTLSYKSSSTKIATVDANGVVTAKKTGKTTITVTTYNGKKATLVIGVTKAPTGVSMTGLRSPLYESETLKLGYTLPNKASGGATFTSSNPEVVSVTPDGQLKAVSKGTATITVTTYNGKKKTANVTVYAEPTAIYPALSEVSIGAEDSWVLGYSFKEGEMGSVTFKSTNEEVATVDASGRIRALKEGETEIILTTHNEKEAKCKVKVTPAPAGITLSGRTWIGLGEKIQLEAIIDPEGTMGTLSYKSSSTKVATVDGNGVVTAKKTGKTTITVTTYNGKKATLVIGVTKAPTGVSMTGLRSPLYESETLKLGYTLPNKASGGATFTSSNPEVVSVTPDGQLKAVSKGTATITVTTYNGKKKTANVTVYAEPTAVYPALSEVSIGAEDSWVLGYSFKEGEMGSVTFESTNEEVATVDASGRIRALKEGETEIILTTHNEKEAKCKVTVTPAPNSVTLSGRTWIGLGEKIQLEAIIDPEGTMGTLSYKSSSTKVATVDGNGVVTAKKTGKTTITVTTYNGKKATLVIGVTKAPTGVSMTGMRSPLYESETLKLGYTLPNKASGGATFTSSNPEVVSVTPDGQLKAVSKGTATITVTTYNGKKKTANVTVYAEPTAVYPALSEVSIGAEDSWVLGYSFKEGEMGSVTFKSTNEEVATVDARGRIRALKEGETEIILTTHNEKEAKCRVTVTPAPNSVTLSGRTWIGLGEKIQLEAIIDPEGTMGTLSYKSSSTKVATVDANGVVTAKKTGKTTITVTTYNGKKATLVIGVTKAPTGVSMTGMRSPLYESETLKLGYTLPNKASGAATFTSSNPEVVSVTPDGQLKAVSKGTATITVTTYNGKKKTANVTVYAEPTAVYPALSEVSIGAEDSWVLGYSFKEGEMGSVTFKSTNEEVATVDARGRIRALKEGETEIILTTHNEKEAKCKVTVTPAPNSVTLSGRTWIGLGEKIQLDAIIDPEGTMGTLSYKSSSTSIATIDANGVVTGKKTGKTTITVTTYNGKKATLVIGVTKAPTGVSMTGMRSPLGVGEKIQLGYTLPNKASGGATFTSSNPDVATVTPGGQLTAVAKGSATITVTTYNGKTTQKTVTVADAPTDITMFADPVMGVGESQQIHFRLIPETSCSALRYSVVSGDAVVVDESGNLMAVGTGEAVVRVSTYLDDVYAEQRITVKPAPTSLSFATSSYQLSIEDTLQLEPIIDEGSHTSLTYAIKTSGIFDIDENGLVTPARRGTSAVTVSTHNGYTATITIQVYDPYFPETMDWEQTPPGFIYVGDSYAPKLKIFPETAVANLVWTSSAPEILKIDETTGVMKAISTGIATITVKSTRNPALTLSFKILVPSDTRCLVMPKSKITNVSGIEANMASIRAVRDSAYAELLELMATGVISESQYKTRREIITRAFDMYLFPWMTQTTELYWKEANSEGGAKNFKPGNIYFGVAYTQSNRVNTPDSMINAGYYKSSGKGYYLMNGSKFSNRLYPGSDCSSFASIATWGMGSSRRSDSTRSIGSASYYTTLYDWTALRPGDLLNRSGRHVVIFLYYANAEKTQMVIIEQGGGAWDTNTVSCSVRNISDYRNNGYLIRRASIIK